MTSAPGRWDDLVVRVVSGGVLALLGIAAVWAGGVWFLGVTLVIAVAMIWEMTRMLAPAGPAPLLAGVAGGALALAALLPAGLGVPLAMVPAVVGLAVLDRHKATFAIFALMVVLAAYGLFVLRQDHGVLWIGWLISVVIVTDVVGYFAGRLIGGPRFWPRFSPKKTWSGTAAGWIGAALVGWLFSAHAGGSAELIGISVAASMASQLGDIAESAVKRRAGVKDSSGLLPGHGGVFDRFDGMLGASVFLLLVGPIAGFPPGT